MIGLNESFKAEDEIFQEKKSPNFSFISCVACYFIIIIIKTQIVKPKHLLKSVTYYWNSI